MTNYSLEIRKATLDVYLMYERSADHFTAQLMRLWMKADNENKLKLRVVFLYECDAMQEWYETANPWSFYRKYNIEELFVDPSERKYYEQQSALRTANLNYGT